jgi:hypothetical protein
MWVTALIIAESIRVMPAKHFKDLVPIPQMHFGDATRTRLPVGDHCLSIGMQVVMGVSSARCGVIGFGIVCTIGRTPAAKAYGVVSQCAAVKTDSSAIATPKFVLVPLSCALSWDGIAPLVWDIEQPHSIWQIAVFMAEQNEITILRIDMHMIDPELFFTQHFFCLSRDRVQAVDGAGRFLKESFIGELLALISALRAFDE